MGDRSISTRILEDLDLKERKYLLTHDDDTSQLVVYIGSDFPKELFGKARDEVMAYWHGDVFKVSCSLDNENSSFPLGSRYKIFKAHMRNSVLAIYKGEDDFKEGHLSKKLEIHYKSKDPAYNEIETYESLSDLICQDGQLRDFDTDFDYSKYEKKGHI